MHEEIARREEVAIRKLVDEVLGTAEGQPEVRIVALAGATGPVLVEQSRTAQLLIVGHRGRGELASTLLGSVGLYCVLHEHSPVLAGPSARGCVGWSRRAHGLLRTADKAAESLRKRDRVLVTGQVCTEA